MEYKMNVSLEQFAKESCTSKGGSPRCEVIPQVVKAPGNLYMWFPIRHCYNKLSKFLSENDFSYESLEQGQGIVVTVEKDIKYFVNEIESLFTSVEIKDIRCLYKKIGYAPELVDLGNVCSLKEWINYIKSDWLIELLKENRLTTFFQPIVHAQKPREVFAHECLLRGLDETGSPVSPKMLFDLARECSLLFQLDQSARRTALRCAKEKEVNTNLFINFNPSSIYDPVFCLQATFRIMEELGMESKNIIFEVVECDQVNDIEHLKTILDYYRSVGFRIALDDIGSGYSSLNLLHQLSPDFIKLDMELIRDVHNNSIKSIVASKLIEIANEMGIQTIAEGIETEQELNWIKENGADYFQGYYFAKPSAEPWKPE